MTPTRPGDRRASRRRLLERFLASPHATVRVEVTWVEQAKDAAAVRRRVINLARDLRREALALGLPVRVVTRGGFVYLAREEREEEE